MRKGEKHGVFSGQVVRLSAPRRLPRDGGRDFGCEWNLSAIARDRPHGPAEKLFVDFAGDTVPVFNAATAA
jgi:hypothetical protein